MEPTLSGVCADFGDEILGLSPRHASTIEPDEAFQVLAHRDLPGFVAISTSTLADWNGATSEWKVADDVLQSVKGGSGIYTTRAFDDFTIRLEYLAADDSDGSLVLRSLGDGEDASGEIVIPLLGASSYAEGSGPPLRDTIARRAARCVAVGRWNFQEVTIRGQRISVELNGCRVLEGQLPLLGASEVSARGTVALVAGGAGLSVRNVLVHPHAPAWPGLEPFMASRFWEAVPAFSGVETGSRHTPDTLMAAVDFAESLFAGTRFAKDAGDSLITGETPAYEEPGDALSYPVAPILMHALAPLWDDESWDETDQALAEACAALLARLPDGQTFEFVSGDAARNHVTLGAVAQWFRAQVSSASGYAAMIYTLDDGPCSPIVSATDVPLEVEERLPIGLDAELRLLAHRPDGHQVLEVARGGRILHRAILTEIPSQDRLTFDEVADALELGQYGWRVQMRFGVHGDIELMTLYLDVELRPVFYFTSW